MKTIFVVLMTLATLAQARVPAEGFSKFNEVLNAKLQSTETLGAAPELRKAKAEYVVMKTKITKSADGKLDKVKTPVCVGEFQVSVYGRGDVSIGQPQFTCATEFDGKVVYVSGVGAMYQDSVDWIGGSKVRKGALAATLLTDGSGTNAHLPGMDYAIALADETNKELLLLTRTANPTDCGSTGCDPKWNEEFEVFINFVD